MNYPITPKKIIVQRNSPKSIRFNLLHIDKLASRQSSKASPTASESLINHLKNRGALSSIRKYHKQVTPTKLKSIGQHRKSVITEPTRQIGYTSVCKQKPRSFLEKKRFSTQCANYHLLQTNDTQEIAHNNHRSEEVNPQKGIMIRILKRNNKITINKLLEQKYQKKREYQFSKLSRTNIIPDYLIFSKRERQDQQKRLIKNISQKIYSQYRISPNFQSLNN